MRKTACIRRIFSLCFVAALLPATAFSQSFLSQYKGSPFHDSRYNGGPQKIPGKVLCAYYDLGGEGVAYHDSDPQNHGSGELNPADGSYLNEFRMHEGVDTSYTKFNRKPDPIDDNPFSKIVPPADLPYVGWTDPGEWFNITVDVTRAGTYAADFLYTSNRGGTISIDVNGKDATGPLEITSTNDPRDPLAWRQWHHWNLALLFFQLHLDQGRNVLTVHILTLGNMNLAYFDFKPVDKLYQLECVSKIGCAPDRWKPRTSQFAEKCSYESTTTDSNCHSERVDLSRRAVEKSRESNQHPCPGNALSRGMQPRAFIRP